MLSLKDVNIYEGEVLETKKGHRFIVLLNTDSSHIKLASLETGQVVFLNGDDETNLSIFSKLYKDYRCDRVVWGEPKFSIEVEDLNEYNYLNHCLEKWRSGKL